MQESRRSLVSMICQNDGANLLTKRCGIVEKNRSAAGLQITIGYHPYGVE